MWSSPMALNGLNAMHESPVQAFSTGDNENRNNCQRSRQKACLACAQAKRRCNRRLPQCARCLEKGFRCAYTNRLAMASSGMAINLDVPAFWFNQPPSQQLPRQNTRGMSDPNLSPFQCPILLLRQSSPTSVRVIGCGSLCSMKAPFSKNFRRKMTVDPIIACVY